MNKFEHNFTKDQVIQVTLIHFISLVPHPPPPTPKPKIIIVITLSSNLGNLFIKNSQNHNTFGYQSITIQIFTYCYSIIYFCMCPITFAYQSFLFYILLPRTCTRRWWHEQIFHAQNCDTNEVWVDMWISTYVDYDMVVEKTVVWITTWWLGGAVAMVVILVCGSSQWLGLCKIILIFLWRLF